MDRRGFIGGMAATLAMSALGEARTTRLHHAHGGWLSRFGGLFQGLAPRLCEKIVDERVVICLLRSIENGFSIFIERDINSVAGK